MKYKNGYNFIFLFLFIKFLSSVEGYESFKKYGQCSTDDNFVVFETNGFIKGDTMYFKITAKVFVDNSLYYKYIDSLESDPFINKDDFKEVKYTHKNELTEKDEKYQIRFCEIVKKSEDMNGLEGKYLLLYFNTQGRVKIENTEKDEGKQNYIYTIIFSIVGLIIAGVIISCCCYCCCCRGRKQSKHDIIRLNNNPQQPINLFQDNQSNDLFSSQTKRNFRYNMNMNMNNDKATFNYNSNILSLNQNRNHMNDSIDVYVYNNDIKKNSEKYSSGQDDIYAIYKSSGQEDNNSINKNSEKYSSEREDNNSINKNEEKLSSEREDINSIYKNEEKLSSEREDINEINKNNDNKLSSGQEDVDGKNSIMNKENSFESEFDKESNNVPPKSIESRGDNP